MKKLPVPCLVEVPSKKRQALWEKIQSSHSLAGLQSNMGLLAVTGLGYTFEEGRVLTVAFNGGADDLRTDIANWSKEWEQYANIKFEFGRDDNPDEFREWTTEDKKNKADIRISFESTEQNSGYWSAIGNDIDMFDEKGRPFYAANIPTMNYEDLRSHTPAKQRAFVLHEFGHAIGFLHEHQSPEQDCDSEFRWLDDLGYNPGPLNEQEGYAPDANGLYPGIYRVMENPPYEWAHEDIDKNMRTLETSYAFVRTEFDPDSIMKYYYPPWMYYKGEESRCYSSQENMELSELDKVAAAEAYSFDEESIQNALNRKLEAIKKLSESGQASTAEIEFLNKTIGNSH